MYIRTVPESATDKGMREYVVCSDSVSLRVVGGGHHSYAFTLIALLSTSLWVKQTLLQHPTFLFCVDDWLSSLGMCFICVSLECGVVLTWISLNKLMEFSLILLQLVFPSLFWYRERYHIYLLNKSEMYLFALWQMWLYFKVFCKSND